MNGFVQVYHPHNCSTLLALGFGSLNWWSFVYLSSDFVEDFFTSAIFKTDWNDWVETFLFCFFYIFEVWNTFASETGERKDSSRGPWSPLLLTILLQLLPVTHPSQACPSCAASVLFLQSCALHFQMCSLIFCNLTSTNDLLFLVSSSFCLTSSQIYHCR